MVAINFATAVKDAEVSKATTGFTDVDATDGTAAITSGNFTSGRKYLIVVRCECGGDSSFTAPAWVQMVHGSTAFTGSEFKHETRGATIKTQYSWCTLWTAVASEDIKLQYAANGTDTSKVDSVSIIAVELSEELTENTDFHSDTDDDSGAPTALTSTYADFASITFTPGTASHDWLVCGFSQAATVVGNRSIQTRLNQDSDTVVVPEVFKEGEVGGSGDYIISFIARTMSLTAASHTFTIQCSQDITNTATHDYSFIFALDLNSFDVHAVTQTDGGVSEGTADDVASGVNVATVSITPNGATDDVVVLGYCVSVDASATNTFRRRLQYDNSDAFNLAQTTDNFDAGNQHDPTDRIEFTMCGVEENPGASSKAIDIDASSNVADEDAEQRMIVAFTTEVAGGVAVRTLWSRPIGPVI